MSFYLSGKFINKTTHTMKSDLKSLDELSRREFVASAAKACLGVGLLPMAGSYVHTPVEALQPGPDQLMPVTSSTCICQVE